MYTEGQARKILTEKCSTDWGFQRFPIYGILPDFGEMVKKKTIFKQIEITFVHSLPQVEKFFTLVSHIKRKRSSLPNHFAHKPFS